MKNLKLSTGAFLFLLFTAFLSCQKDNLECLDCEDNDPPIVIPPDPCDNCNDTIPPPPDGNVPSGFVKVYGTDFEDVRKVNDNNLDWDFPHWFEFAAMHKEDGGKGNGEGGAWFWVDDYIAHTGSKSIGLEVFDIEQSRRSELILFPEGYLGSEYYVSYWLYIPSDFILDDPRNWNWLELGNPFHTGGHPYGAIHVVEPDASQRNYTVEVNMRDKNGKMHNLGSDRFELPKERWFQVEYHVKRDNRNGSVKLWIDGRLIADQNGISTSSATENFNISIAKIYHERGDKTPKKLWVDNLEMYSPSK